MVPFGDELTAFNSRAGREARSMSTVHSGLRPTRATTSGCFNS